MEVKTNSLYQTTDDTRTTKKTPLFKNTFSRQIEQKITQKNNLGLGLSACCTIICTIGTITATTAFSTVIHNVLYPNNNWNTEQGAITGLVIGGAVVTCFSFGVLWCLCQKHNSRF